MPIRSNSRLSFLLCKGNVQKRRMWANLKYAFISKWIILTLSARYILAKEHLESDHLNYQISKYYIIRVFPLQKQKNYVVLLWSKIVKTTVLLPWFLQFCFKKVWCTGNTLYILFFYILYLNFWYVDQIITYTSK